MKKIAPFRFFDEEDIFLADHQPPPNDLQVVSCGRRRITLPSNQESHYDHGRQTLSTGTILNDLVYNPTPLRWYRPSEADFNGDDRDKVDDVSRNPSEDLVETPSNLDGCRFGEVDNTLRLSNYFSRNSEIPPVKKCTNNPTPLRWFHADFFDGIEDDEVDTTLSLGPPGSSNPSKSRKQAKGKRKADDDDVVEDREKKRRSKWSRNEDDGDQRPLIPMEEIEVLFQAIQSRNGSRPVFLYRKKLEDSDVKRNLNRMFVTRREKMMGFLREEEAAAVDGGGLEIKLGVDGGGKVYENLGLKKWESLKMTVINKNWGKVVEANNAKKGDVVEIWGFRVMDEKPCLAFNFRRDNAAASSGTTCTDEGTSQV